jgi:uncharacterized protein (DUF433 family)
MIMTKLQEALTLIEQLNSEDKLTIFAQLSSIVFHQEDTEVGIVKTEGICGGSARIANTRIPVSGIVDSKRLGMTDEQILEAYPTLRLTDIEQALLYYARHRSEIETELNEEELS